MNNGGKTLLILIGIFLGLLAVGNLITGGTGTSKSPSTASQGQSLLACDHFHNIMRDVTDGVLTDAELRTKISEVRSSATSNAVRNAATEMLAAITARDKAGTTAAAFKLSAACKGA